MSLHGQFPQRREAWDSFTTRTLNTFITSMENANVEVINKESKEEVLNLLSIFARDNKFWQVDRFFNNSIPEEWIEEARQNEKKFRKCLALINKAFGNGSIESMVPFERAYQEVKLGNVTEVPGLTLICSFLDEVMEWTYGL